MTGRSGRPTPLVNLRACITRHNNKKTLTTIRALPDMGASIDIVSLKFARRNKLTIAEDKDGDIELIAAEGNKIVVTGTTELGLQLPGGGWIQTTALVCPRLSHECLLSWISQKKLRLLHKGWPFSPVPEYGERHTAHSAQSSVIPSSMKAPEPPAAPTAPVWPPEHFPQRLKDLCAEYEDVLVESLTPDQRMFCNPMEVSLADGVKPFYARRPRKFPLHSMGRILESYMH